MIKTKPYEWDITGKPVFLSRLNIFNISFYYLDISI